MTNREKYFFDDFTMSNYKKLIYLALDKGFSFISHKDEFVPERKDVIWRHDVEFEPDIALKMAQIEASAGVLGSYFFQLHSSHYNLFDNQYSAVFHQIHDLGHHVGLHFDCRYWNITSEDKLERFIIIDKNYLETTLGVSIEAFSFHNTTSFTRNCLNREYGGLINVYSSFFKDHFSYCGDSLGYWRFDRLEDVLKDDSVRHLQVLTHDGNWSDEVLSPRKRIAKVVYDRAERLINNQIAGLHRKGFLCPDDDED